MDGLSSLALHFDSCLRCIARCSSSSIQDQTPNSRRILHFPAFRSRCSLRSDCPLHQIFEARATNTTRYRRTAPAIEGQVQGLNAGAVDYLVTPFASPELLARVRALLLRRGMQQVERPQLAGLKMDLATRKSRKTNPNLDTSSFHEQYFPRLSSDFQIG